MATDRRSGWTRRRLLVAGGAAALAATPLARAGMRWASRGDELFVSAGDDREGRHFIAASNGRGERSFSVEVEARCHGIALDPVRPGRAVVIARRPGTAAYDVDLHAGAIRKQIRSAKDRHFYGHAVFSHDGSVLFTSENDIPRSEGVIAVRDAADLRVLSELRTRGIGPHELLLARDGRTLVVANGGLVSDLADGTRRRDLNIPEMDPSLVYLDSHDGRLLAQIRPDDHFASIRHLALADDGVIAVAMQYEGPQTNPYPVLGFHRGDEHIRNVVAPRDTLIRMTRYAASVCIAPSGIAAVTCPRGDLVSFFDVACGELVGAVEIRDAGGVATTAGGEQFLITTGLGEVHRIDARRPAASSDVQRSAMRWDNHVRATSAA